MTTAIPVPTDILEAIAFKAGTPIELTSIDTMQVEVPINGRTALVFRSTLTPAQPGKCPCGRAGCSDSGLRF